MNLALLEQLSRGLMLMSGAYLGWRLLTLMVRVRRSRRAYPVLTDVPACNHETEDRSAGVLLGIAVGDALGLPAESLPPSVVRMRYRNGPAMRRGLVRFMRRSGDVSADTQLTIAVARSVDPDGTYRPERFSDELAQWSTMRVGAGRATTRAAIAARQHRPAKALPSDGNGAAMRVAPLAIAHRDDGDEAGLLRAVDANARATHAGDLAIAGAKMVAMMTWQMLRSPKAPPCTDDDTKSSRHTFRQMIALIIKRSAAASGFPIANALHAIESNASATEAMQQVGTSAYALHSVAAAVVAVARSGNNFATMMNTIFAAGGDVDTIGAMAGGILGAAGGVEAIPAKWRRDVAHRDYLTHLAHRLSTPIPTAKRLSQIIETHGDIAHASEEVIVNAWNRNFIPRWLLLPQGVSRAIARAGGSDAIREISRRGPIPLGGASETSAANLKATWMIHVAGINAVWHATPNSVARAANSALTLARWLGASSVAMPIIGAGSGGLNATRCTDVIRREMESYRPDFDQLNLVHWNGKPGTAPRQRLSAD